MGAGKEGVGCVALLSVELLTCLHQKVLSWSPGKVKEMEGPESMIIGKWGRPEKVKNKKHFFFQIVE